MEKEVEEKVLAEGAAGTETGVMFGVFVAPLGHSSWGKWREVRPGPGCRDGKGWCVFLPASLPAAEAYVGGVLFCLGIFLSFYLLTILLACWENWR